MSDERETYEAIEQRRNDPEFAARVGRAVTELAREISRLSAERDALAAIVERVRALCDEVERVGRKPDWSISTARIRRALAAEPSP